jgi:hypothetical protein
MPSLPPPLYESDGLAVFYRPNGSRDLIAVFSMNDDYDLEAVVGLLGVQLKHAVGVKFNSKNNFLQITYPHSALLVKRQRESVARAVVDLIKKAHKATP